MESKIDELQSSTGGLSQEVAKLDKDIAANKQAQEEATAIRKRENEDFLALEKDLGHEHPPKQIGASAGSRPGVGRGSAGGSSAVPAAPRRRQQRRRRRHPLVPPALPRSRSCARLRL